MIKSKGAQAACLFVRVFGTDRQDACATSFNAAKPSPCKNSIRSATPFRAAFSLASASASAEISVAVIFASGHFTASAMAMQPVPVPKSKAVEG